LEFGKYHDTSIILSSFEKIFDFNHFGLTNLFILIGFRKKMGIKLEELEKILKERIKIDYLKIDDESGGCGSMFKVNY
jgi:hypothetical protein